MGNPGNEYVNTRHNLGRLVVEHLVDHSRVKENPRRARYRLWRVILARRQLSLVSPRSYINDSGRAVLSFLTAARLRPQQVLVVCDDVALPLGGMRLRCSGSSGGHRGLESIIRLVGDSFPRLRLGVGAAGGDMVDHVLGEFSADESKIVEKILPLAEEVIAGILRQGLEPAMSTYNRKELWIRA